MTLAYFSDNAYYNLVQLNGIEGRGGYIYPFGVLSLRVARKYCGATLLVCDIFFSYVTFIKF